MSEHVDAIRVRWSMHYNRGAHDYTDEGCRVLAEHGFRDVNALLAALARERERTTALARRMGQAEAELYLHRLYAADDHLLGNTNDRVADYMARRGFPEPIVTGPVAKAILDSEDVEAALAASLPSDTQERQT